MALGSFVLRDPATLAIPKEKSFSGLGSQTFTFTQAAPFGYVLNDITCNAVCSRMSA